MPEFPRRWLFLLGAALTGAAHAAALPPDTLRELDAAEHQLERAALLQYVATDTTEAAHLLDARDRLREAEPILRGRLHERVLRLDFDIGRDAGAAAAELSVPPPDALSRVSVAPLLDRADLGALAQRAERIVLQAQVG